MDETKILLSEKEMPRRWYNIAPDLPAPLAPVLHPGTGKPIGPADLAPLFPMELIKQEVSQDRRSEERRVGKECRRLCRSRWSPDH
jgi:tryptophan synthase beta chain